MPKALKVRDSKRLKNDAGFSGLTDKFNDDISRPHKAERAPKRPFNVIKKASYQFRCFLKCQPTVKIIMNIIMISAHSERVGIGAGDGVGAVIVRTNESAFPPEPHVQV